VIHWYLGLWLTIGLNVLSAKKPDNIRNTLNIINRENTNVVDLSKKRCFHGGVCTDNEVICIGALEQAAAILDWLQNFAEIAMQTYLDDPENILTRHRTDSKP